MSAARIGGTERQALLRHLAATLRQVAAGATPSEDVSAAVCGLAPQAEALARAARLLAYGKGAGSCS